MEMKFEDFITCIKAGYSHFYFQTREMERAEDRIRESLESYTNGNGQSPFTVNSYGLSDDDFDPVELLRSLVSAPNGTVAILKNFNFFLDEQRGPGAAACLLIQVIQDTLSAFRGKGQRRILVILSSTPFSDGLPGEIVDDFVPFKFHLPGDDEINGSVDYIMESAKRSSVNVKDIDAFTRAAVVNAARGMGKQQIEDAFSYSMITRGELDPVVINRIKSTVLDSVAGIEYKEYSETFDDVKGYDNIKNFVLSTLHSPLAKGIILVGPPGCGKSLFCKCLSNEVKRPTLSVEFGNIFGSLLGETYEKMQALIDIITAMAPCIVFVDEIEKGLAGAGGDGGTTANEVTQRAMGMWLKFMSDRKDGVYIIATCNDINSIPPEYLRAERWDSAPFFIDLPNSAECNDILNHYKGIYGVDGNPGDMDGWSGAEIKSCCRIAAMMGVSLKDSKQYIIPVAKMMGNKIDGFRKWAEKNTIPASTKIKISNKANKRDLQL
jgi:hypothetical protein